MGVAFFVWLHRAHGRSREFWAVGEFQRGACQRCHHRAAPPPLPTTPPLSPQPGQGPSSAICGNFRDSGARDLHSFAHCKVSLVLRWQVVLSNPTKGELVVPVDRKRCPAEVARAPPRPGPRAQACPPGPCRRQSQVQPPALRPAPLPGSVPVPKAARHRREANGLG